MLQEQNEDYPEKSMDYSNLHSFEQRLIRLEENAWFQERKLAALDDHTRELHQQLDALNRQCGALQKALLHLKEELAIARAGNPWQADPPPPHWGIDKA